MSLHKLTRNEVVVVDWNMPQMGGLDFLRAVRAHSDHHAMPIVMITSEVDADRVRQALDAGANEYIMKPFTRTVIAEKLGLLGFAQG